MAGPYYQGSGGDDGNDGLSWGNRFATFQKLLDTIDATAGEYGFSNGETGLIAPADLDNTTGSQTSKPRVYGCDSSGNPYYGSGQVTISTASSIGSLLDIESGYEHWSFFDIIFDGGGAGKATHCVETSTSYNVGGFVWVNCRFTNADTDCIDAYIRPATVEPWVFINCEIDNAGKGGVSGTGIKSNDVSNRCYFILDNCYIHDNLVNGVDLGVSSSETFASIRRNRFAGNGGVGIWMDGDGFVEIAFNVFYDNGGDAIEIEATGPSVSITNNIFSENGGYAINSNSQSHCIVHSSNNCYYSNTSGNYDIGGTPGWNNVTSDPKFTNPGSGDFSLQSDSPCIDAASGYGGDWNIGAWQSTPSGGGGGLLTHPGMGGGLNG